MTTEPIQSTETSQGRRDTHPAFGVAVVTRAHGSPRPLFQSDLLHQDTIVLEIRSADRTRDLNRDWTYPTDSIVEVELSLAQWGELVSAVGIGSGVPVTIRTKGRERVPGIPHQPRVAENMNEVQEAVANLLSAARDSLTTLEDAIETKAGIRATREALRQHKANIVNAEANAAFAVKSLNEAAERVTAHARTEIEAHILRTTERVGTAPIAADPSLFELEP